MTVNRKLCFVIFPVITAGFFACSGQERAEEISRQLQEVDRKFEEQDRLTREIDSIHHEMDSIRKRMEQNDSTDYTFHPEK